MASLIVLLGYMGCGKTKVGEKLSKKIGAKFVDLDSEIEDYHSKSINQIFEEIGEIGFRQIERKILLNILDKNEFSVLSLGGGTPCYFNNMEKINKKTKLTFFLNLDSKALAERLFTRKEKRPILASIQDKNEMIAYVNKHLFERKNYYLKATYTLNSSEKNIKIICNKILSVLEKNSF